MKFRSTRLLILVVVIFCNCNLHLYSQNQSLQDLYNTFDNQIGPQNLGINNGTVHVNTDKSDNKTNRYYLQDKYLSGGVVYDGQPYYDIKLKYDIYADVLVAKVNGENNSTGINLITEKTASFHIGSTKFINLTFGKPELPSFINGYYEVVSASENLLLYIKHHKEKAEVIRPEGKFSNFNTADSFIIRYKNDYYSIRSQSDFNAIFPDLEQQTATFYQINRELRKTDQKQFMRNLVQSTANLLSKDIR